MSDDSGISDFSAEAEELFQTAKELHEKATGEEFSDELFLGVLVANYSDKLGIEIEEMGDGVDLNYLH